MRCTVALLTPTALAIDRVLQCVAASGFSWVVFRTIRVTVSAVMAGVRPGRDASFSIPAVRRAANRLRHRPTVGFEVWSSAAMVSLVLPSAAAKTIFPRNTKREGVLRPRDHVVSVLRSSLASTMIGAVFMGSILL